MNFNKHSDLVDNQLHAFLGASKHSWINYDDEKLAITYRNYLAVQRGTELHDFARHCIVLGQKLPKTKKSLNMFVNDAIGYRMTPEQPLVYSPNCFGTTDAICFNNGILRIHDLKTGATKVSMDQLAIYAALFCLEYDEDPSKISIELRIYQSDDILVCNPLGEDIQRIMDKIIAFDKRIEQLKLEEE